MPDAGQASGFLDKVGIPRALTQNHCLCSAREDRQRGDSIEESVAGFLRKTRKLTREQGVWTKDCL